MLDGARLIGTIRTLSHHSRGCWGALLGWHADLATHASWPHFFQSHTFFLRPFVGHPWRRVQLPHVTAATAVSTTAARGAHRVGSWGLALGWELADQELAIDHAAPLDLLRTYTGARVIPLSLRCLVPSLAKPCDVGFLPVQWYPREDTGLLGEKQLVLWIMAAKILVAVIYQFLEPLVLATILFFFVAVASLPATRGRSFSLLKL